MIIDDGTESATTPFIDYRLDVYKSVFDYEWAKSFTEAVVRSSIQQPGLDLCRDWMGLANVGRMPWLMIESLKNFELGFTQGNPSFSELLMKSFAEWISNDSKFSQTRKKEIVARVNDLGKKILDEMQSKKPAFDPNETWQEYLKIPGFALSLWSGQRTCYSAIYYAYENFIQRCIAAGEKNNSYRSPNATALREGFIKYFGISMADECLSHDEITIARLARNCLAHDGGRVSEKLRTTSHKLMIENGEIHIMPDDVRSLFDLLKSRATKIAECAIKLDAFLKN